MRILIVEDDSEVSEFTSIALEMGWPGAKINQTHLGKQAIELVEKKNYNLIILDLNLPDIDGYLVLQKIRNISSTPVIITSVRCSEAEIVKGLEYGADDYIVKPFGQMELVARGRAVLRRLQESNIYAPITRGPISLDPGRGELVYGSRKSHITRTESLILSLLLQNPGQLVTYYQLEEAIWGEAGTCPNSADSIRVYISRLRSKLSYDHDCKISIQAHAGAGYLLNILQ
ncbi:MAG: response regulator transcription factor [Dehalococcoidales bacterium]|jgi:two-component system KDP operon response regulator KdpE|nr:response regulator transcription factor [Dehalococcoidales bacterium]